MPELPEVETVRRGFERALLGSRVTRVDIRRRDVVRTPARPTPRDLFLHAVIAGTIRHGKQLAILAGDGRAMIVHLGMSGRLRAGARLDDGGSPHTHLVWHAASRHAGRRVAWFNDPRRFGGVWCFESLDHARRARWNDLGPDALTIDGPALARGLASSARAIKACLLDQGVLAGVGNIYADEALFEARLSPVAPATSLGAGEVTRLASAIRSVLARAIDSGGSTLRDYIGADGRPGGFAVAHRVYGRAGQACVACHGRLVTATIAGRTTTWCPSCQRLVAPRTGDGARGFSTRRRDECGLRSPRCDRAACSVLR